MSKLVRENCLCYPETFRAIIEIKNFISVNDTSLVRYHVYNKNLHQNKNGK